MELKNHFVNLEQFQFNVKIINMNKYITDIDSLLI